VTVVKELIFKLKKSIDLFAVMEEAKEEKEFTRY